MFTDFTVWIITADHFAERYLQDAFSFKIVNFSKTLIYKTTCLHKPKLKITFLVF